MLTTFTEAAITVLHDIASGNSQCTVKFSLTAEDLKKILNGLETRGLVRHLSEGEESSLSSYVLCRPLRQITLLEVLEATGEPVHVDYPLPESNYFYHGPAAQKMGVASHMARLFLADIKLTDW